MYRYLIGFFFFQLICLFFSLESIVKQGLTNHIEVNPGDQVPVKFQLINSTNTPQTYTLNHYDYSYQANGEVNYLNAGQHSRSNAAWLHMPVRFVTVPPQGESNVFYDILVPNDPSLSGSYWSVFLIEPRNTLPLHTNSNEGFNLEVKIRYAYQVVTTIKGGTSKIEIEGFELDHIEFDPFLAFNIKNSGTLFLSPLMLVKLYDQKGQLAHTVQTQTQKILPGCSVRYYVPVKGIPSGPYSALIFLDDKQNNVFCYRLNVSI
ncbi:MAG: hypothetical protein LW832_02180 [Parachlamydia sp.]|jgi:hypothetical protein|nr:hypothetical protein [Parachlamydia sp.]